MKKSADYPIEDGIPIPTRAYKRINGRGKYKGYTGTIKKLSISQSVWLPIDIRFATNIGRQVFGKGCVVVRSEPKGIWLKKNLTFYASGTRIWRIK